MEHIDFLQFHFFLLLFHNKFAFYSVRFDQFVFSQIYCLNIPIFWSSVQLNLENWNFDLSKYSLIGIQWIQRIRDLF